jgi:hypothetical protein
MAKPVGAGLMDYRAKFRELCAPAALAEWGTIPPSVASSNRIRLCLILLAHKVGIDMHT